MRKMVSLLRNCLPGQGEESQARPAAEQVAQPAPVLPERGPATALPPLPHTPLNMDTMGGEVTVSYEMLTGKAPRHYTQIFIDPGYLPTINAGKKPDNTQYLAEKHDLLSKAYHALSPYADFMMTLKGMAGRPDLHRGLEVILKRFITRFWDMPASKNHHHAYPWGFMLHCIDVACAEAEKATNWTPMSEHGIDEISQARYLGMVVLMRFTQGLFHDAHKLYQYEMSARLGGATVRFDPLRREGNVLDFKLVYPQRVESWGTPAASPGKLNALEFVSLFPRELLRYAPSSQFIEVYTGLFDLESMESDRDSARRDISRAGRYTLEQFVLNAIKAYFADSDTTRPENNVFRVNDDWTAINGNQFFLKARPVDGGIHTKDGMRKFLLQEEVLARVGNRTDTSLHYKIVMPDGTETASKSMSKISFIRSDYLQQAYTGFSSMIGQVYFLEKDREAVCELCPSADNFLPSLESSHSEPETQKSSDVSAESGNEDSPVSETAHAVPCDMPQGEEPSEEVTAQPTESTEPEASAVVPEDGGDGDAIEPVETTENIPGQEANPLEDRQETPELPPATVRPGPKPMVGFSKQLAWRLTNYRPEDSCPDTGWLFVGIRCVHVRTPQFYQALTNDGLLDEPDWGSVAANICRQLRDESLLVMQPITGEIDYVPPGGGDSTLEGSFLQITPGLEMHRSLLDRICGSTPLTVEA